MRSLFRRSTRGVAGAIAAAVLVGGTAAAVTTDGFGSSGSSSATLATPATPTTVPPTTVPTTAVPTAEAAATTHPVLAAGTVTVALEGAVLRVVDVRTNAGWTNNVERGLDREVEVTFRRGNERVDFNAELEDGQVRIRISDRRTGTATPATGAPSPTVPAP